MVEKEQVILRLKALFDLLTPGITLSITHSNDTFVSYYVSHQHHMLSTSPSRLSLRLFNLRVRGTVNIYFKLTPLDFYVPHHNIICTAFIFSLTTQMIPLCLSHHHRYLIITHSLLKRTANPFRIIRRGYKRNSIILNLLHNPTIDLGTKCSQ